MALVFCVKITFSPAVIGITLALCTYQLNVHNEFPLLEVWATVIRVATWRLPEEVRVVYACVSFVWILTTLLSSSVTETGAGDTVANDLTDSITSMHA